MNKRYEVRLSKKACKSLGRLPEMEKYRFALLLADIRANGPIRKNWKNFSELESGRGWAKYHCHLSYHWVACWIWEKDSIIVEVYYAGSREAAPYK